MAIIQNIKSVDALLLCSILTVCLIIVSCSFDVRMYSRRKAARTSERANERTSERAKDGDELYREPIRALWPWAASERNIYLAVSARSVCRGSSSQPTFPCSFVRSLVRSLVGSFGKSLANLQAFQRSIFIYFYVESSWKLHRVKADLWIFLKTNETKHSLYLDDVIKLCY